MLSSLGKKIFIDRYAKKQNDNFAEGDKVLVLKGGQSLLGTVLSLSLEKVSLQLESGEIISCEKSNVAKPLEEPEAMFKRVAVQVANVEDNKALWTAEFFHLMNDFKFIPGGRILSAAGNENLTFYNCFVLPSPKDCREGRLRLTVLIRWGILGVMMAKMKISCNHSPSRLVPRIGEGQVGLRVFPLNKGG